MSCSRHPYLRDHLDSMRAQERTVRRSPYLTGDPLQVNADCRRAMVAWMTVAQQSLALSSDVVWRAFDLVDRCLGSGRGRSQEVLRSNQLFQLLVVTAFYTVVKIHEPVVIDVDTLVQICRGEYRRDDIVAMEAEMLAALEWRVAGHTPMEFARHLLALLGGRLASRDADGLLGTCQDRVDRAVADPGFAGCAPSAVGTACLAGAVEVSRRFSPAAKRKLWSALAEACHFDLSSEDVVEARRRLRIDGASHEPTTMSPDGSRSPLALGRTKASASRSFTSISDLD